MFYTVDPMSYAPKGADVVVLPDNGFTGSNTGLYYTSSPGTWSTITLPSNVRVSDLCWSGSLFVGVIPNTGDTFTSSDGLNWTRHFGVGFNSSWVCWSADLGVFCAVRRGANGITGISTDGVSWTTSAQYNFNNDTSGIVWSPALSKFCMTTGQNINVLTQTAAFTSPDGLTWTQHNFPAFDALQDITWSPQLGIFLAVSTMANNVTYSRRAWRSIDGASWTFSTILDQDVQWNSVAWSAEKGLFATVGVSHSGIGKCATSSDGINWTERSIPNHSWRDVVWTGREFIAIAFNSSVAAHSLDGITWTSKALPIAGPWNTIAAKRIVPL